MEKIISIRGLRKSFKVHKKEKGGLLYSVISLFNRKYQIVNAVSNIDLTVNKGEIRGLIGPNGAGKSTTVKILSGILYPDEGEVQVMGYIPWKQREEYVRNIGVVFGQKNQLILDLPAIDTYLINREMYKIPAKKFNENIEYFKDLLDIAEVIQRPVRQLSLGEKMKCELVCALLHEPKLVYLDEPTIGLDIISKDNIRNFIKKVNAEKQTTFIITTHDMSDIENLCNNITIINHGSIVYDDSITNLKSFYSKKKLIDLLFSRPIEMEILNGYKVVNFNSISAKIEIDLSNKDLQEEVRRLLQLLPVQDMNMHGIEIETLIKQIYNQQK